MSTNRTARLAVQSKGKGGLPKVKATTPETSFAFLANDDQRTQAVIKWRCRHPFLVSRDGVHRGSPFSENLAGLVMGDHPLANTACVVYLLQHIGVVLTVQVCKCLYGR